MTTRKKARSTTFTSSAVSVPSVTPSLMSTHGTKLSKALMKKLRIPDSGYLDFVKSVANQMIGQNVLIEKKGEHHGKALAIVKSMKPQKSMKSSSSS